MKNKEQSDADTSGHVGPKIRVWGEPQQAAFVPLVATEALLCHLAAAPKMAQKQRPLFWNLRFSGFLNALGCGFYHDKLFFIHGV